MTVIDKRLVISEDSIAEKIQELALIISNDYSDKDLVLVGVLKGVFIFMADLVRKLTIPVRVDFIRLASYGESVNSSGCVTLVNDIESKLEGRDVLIVEDIADSGLTLDWLQKHLRECGASSVKTCVLIDKKERRDIPLNLDYVGFEVETGFLVGYGLDFDDQYRHLPAIFQLVMA